MRVVPMVVLLGIALMVSSNLPAQDFRVDTQVFVEDEKQPVADTQTIFFGGRVYEFLLGHSPEIIEITIFDPGGGRFTLLDPARKLQCTIASQELLDYVLELNKAALAGKTPLLAAAADPQFEVKAEPHGDGATARTKVGSRKIRGGHAPR